MFPLICVGINGWINNREAGDLRGHCAHYDVIVMYHSRTGTWATHQCFLDPVWWTKHYIQYPFLVHGVSAIAVIGQANKGSLLVHCDVEKEKAGIGASYTISFITSFPLLWRHNGRDGVSNHQPHDYLLNGSFRRRSKKTSKPRVIGLCEGLLPHKQYFSGTLLGISSCASYVSRTHDVIDDVTRARSRSYFEIDTSPSIFELERRPKAHANGYLSGIFNFGYSFRWKSLSRAQNGGHFINFEWLNTASTWPQIWKDRSKLSQKSFLWWWRHRWRHKVASTSAISIPS